MQAAVPGCFVKRWWGRGPQKSPPETFVRGLAVPPCSPPRDHAKKDPKKLCAFWGFISVPVVGVEPTRCHHQRILSPSRLPIPTHRLICCLYSILQAWQKIKIYFALIFRAIPHNSKCRYGERGAAAAGAVLKPSGGNCAVLPYASNTLKIHPWHSPHYWAQLFLGGVFPYHAGIFPGNRCGKGQRGNLCYAGNHLPDPHFLAVVPSGAGMELVGVPAFRNHLR